MKKYTLTKELIKKINETEKELSFSEISIRSLAEDEQYSVGKYCENSYDWDHEHDCSTYNTDPVELNGSCAIGIGIGRILYLDTEDDGDFEKATEILCRSLEKSELYHGKKAIIIGDLDGYGEDDGEVIIRNAQVLMLLD